MMKHNDITILFVSFWIGFVSDIVLNYLSSKKSGKIIESLRPYFEKQTCLFAAIYAGLTTMPLVYISWKFANNLIQSITLAFVIGYIADIAIDKYKIFGDDLDYYYAVAGSGFWGGAAIIFALLVTLIISLFLKVKLP
tara:strand:- start:407 stop:820 length:414 start_codon:yes stop_codon:yes gene_type:complete